MEQKRQNKQKRRAAFTLAEFLTVIAIGRYSCPVFLLLRYSLPKKSLRPSGDGSDGEGDLSGRAQNHLTLEVSSGTIPRLLHMEAQEEFSDDQKQAKLGISVDNTVLAEEKEENIYGVLYVPEKSGRAALNRNKKSLAVRWRWHLRM